MSHQFSTLTKPELYIFGLSDGMLRPILKEVKTKFIGSQFKEYSVLEVQAAIVKRLENPRIRPKTRAILYKTFTCLNGDSNVIKIDFLQGLSCEQRLKVLYERLQTLEVQEQQLIQQTNKLIIKAQYLSAKNK